MKKIEITHLLRKPATGLAAIVLALSIGGCSAPIANWHTRSGAPVEGLVPYTLSGESHHGIKYDQETYSRQNDDYFTFVKYPLR
jgi:hypothetical protein